MVNEACDRLEYSGSPIYDEYPDRETILRIRDGIIKKGKEAGEDVDPELAQVLLVNEMTRRRLTERF
jgi:hypothetical protein